MVEFPQWRTGWIEIVTGPMFCGKSEELIRRLRRAIIAKQEVMVFKPATDDRYHEEDIVSHNQQRLKATAVENAAQIFERVTPQTQVVGIDEVQFFGKEIVQVCESLADKGMRVLVAGLDQDYRGEPFEPMPQLMAVAESITKLQAVCVQCGAPATRSQRLVDGDSQVLVGATEAYEARCRSCYLRQPE